MDGLGERYARDAISDECYKLPKDTTYKEWKAKQAASHGAGTVDKERKKSYNIGADSAQYEDYLSRLGEDAPATFEDFQKLKYDNPTAYNDLCGLYSYKGRVPEATTADYKGYKAVKATGIYGTVRVPPDSIDTSILTIDTEHIAKRGHNVTLDEALSYIQNVDVSLRRTLQNGKHFINFYSKDGAAYVDVAEKEIRTAFKCTEFDNDVKRIREALENAK